MSNTYLVKHQFTQDIAVAYAAGDVLEGEITLTGLGLAGGALHSVTLFNREALTFTLNLHLFGSAAAGGTITDNAAYVIADADDAHYITTVQVANWFDIASKKVAVENSIGLALPQTKSGDVFMIPEFRTAYTPTDADGLRLILGILPG
jgi:hypothetical protein